MTMIRRLSTWVAAAGLLFVGLPSATAAQQQPKADPVPDMYLGGWYHHGLSLTITGNDYAPETASVLAQWRVYSWCVDPTTGRHNPPPCDSVIGNGIEDGGLGSIVIVRRPGQDDRLLFGTVVATSDTGFLKWGGDVGFQMLPGHMLLMDVGGQQTMLCSDTTDYSLYPPAPCGA